MENSELELENEITSVSTSDAYIAIGDSNQCVSIFPIAAL